jgi:hypothetical protein
VISSLSGTKPNNVWTFHFKDNTLINSNAQLAGEFRYLSAVCAFSPLTATLDDRISLNPHFQDTSHLDTAAQFVNNGRKIRKADQPFSITLQGPSEAESFGPSKSIEGGIDIFWYTPPPISPAKQTNFGLISVKITYQIRWKKPIINEHSAT